jgi:nucleoside-diphosphate-sugar epimerase
MILLTGATGLLGPYLIDELLAEGHDLRVLVRGASQRELPWRHLVEVIEGDLLDVVALGEATAGVQVVVHAAAMVSFDRRDRDQLMQTNVTGTANLVDACLEAGVGRLIHVSSVAAIGQPTDGEQATEKTPWQADQAVSAYARSKRRAELEVYRGIAEGLPAQIINPGLMLGPRGDWSQSSLRLFATAAQGLRFYQRGHTAMVGAQDVARCVALMLGQALPEGERYLLVTDTWSGQRMLSAFAAAVGQRPPTIGIPGWLSLSAAWVVETVATVLGRRPALSVEAIRSGLSNDRYDGRKATTLGFAYTPLEDVIAETARGYLAAHGGG